jgi:hypothetical protein
MAEIHDIAKFLSYKGMPFFMNPPLRRSDAAGELAQQGMSLPELVAVAVDTDRRDLLGRTIPMPLSIDGYYLPNAVIQVSTKNNVVSTPVSGREGSVHEYINAEDYSVRIRGALFGSNGTYPYDALKELREICRKNTALRVSNALLAQFQIEYLVITAFEVPPVKWQNIAFYEISAISDFEYELIID